MRILKKEKKTLKELQTLRERLPTNTLSHNHRVQRWANFIAGYSVEFVEECLSNKNPIEDTVIDPFLGCGTTLITAKNMGFKGTGYDRHPVFFNLALAKLKIYSLADIDKIRSKILTHEHPIIWSKDAEIFIRKLFSENDLDNIRRAAAAVKTFKSRLQPLAIAVFLKSCEASCGAKTDGIYKAPTSLKNKIPFENAVEKAYSMFREDIIEPWYKDHLSKQPESICYNKSSTNLMEVKSNSIGICITSPPYLNNFDYAEMTRMHLYLLGWAGSWREISNNVRNELITNTTTALNGKKVNEKQMQLRSNLSNSLLIELDEIVSNLITQRKTRAGKKDYDYLVYPYYSEIKNVLSELYRCLKVGGEVNWVVADAALYGIHLKTHMHTAQIMKELGYKNVEVIFVRKRGHRWILDKRDGAKEDLGEYHIKAVK